MWHYFGNFFFFFLVVIFIIPIIIVRITFFYYLHLHPNIHLYYYGHYSYLIKLKNIISNIINSNNNVDKSKYHCQHHHRHKSIVVVASLLLYAVVFSIVLVSFISSVHGISTQIRAPISSKTKILSSISLSSVKNFSTTTEESEQKESGRLSQSYPTLSSTFWEKYLPFRIKIINSTILNSNSAILTSSSSSSSATYNLDTIDPLTTDILLRDSPAITTITPAAYNNAILTTTKDPSETILHDPLLTIDSPLYIEQLFDCTIRYQQLPQPQPQSSSSSTTSTSTSTSTSFSEANDENVKSSNNEFITSASTTAHYRVKPNDSETFASTTTVVENNENYYNTISHSPMQVEINGTQCDLINLILLKLRWKSTITQLIIRDTGLHRLDRYYFGDAQLYTLRRIDLISNHRLHCIDQRAFDGLSQLQSIRIVHNPVLNLVNRQFLVGPKQLLELVWMFNAPIDSALLVNLTHATSRHIVPKLRHLHLQTSAKSPTQIPTSQTDGDDDDNVHTIPPQDGMIGIDNNNNGRGRGGNMPELKIIKDDLIQLRTLRSLYLISINLRYIHPIAFAWLEHLESLSLAYNPGLTVENLIQLFSTYQRNTTLTMLDLSGTIQTITLPKLLLSPLGKLPMLRTLHFHSIGVHGISVNDLPPMPSLEHFFLDHNPISFIENGALDPLESIRLLSLRGCHQLKVINSEMFYNLFQLVHLDLSGDPPFSFFPTSSLSSSSSSSFTVYTNNSVVVEPEAELTIEPRTFVGLNLLVLNLSYRRLNPLPSRVFLGLHKTEQLYLRGCGLRSIEYLTFFFLKSLRLLDLSENPRLIKSLRETADDSFFGLESIETLWISGCNLTDDDLDPNNGIFTRMHEHVHELDLSNNCLRQPTAQQLGQFAELRTLNISHNQIVPWWNETLFGNNLDLTQIDLSHNQLNSFSSSMIDDLFRLRHLAFGTNPLQCDCRSELFHLEHSTLIGHNHLNNHHHHDHHNRYFSQQQRTYLDVRNPLYAPQVYYCVHQSNQTQIGIATFGEHCQRLRANGWFDANDAEQRHSMMSIHSMMMILIVLILFLLSLAIIAITFVYYSQLNEIFTMSTGVVTSNDYHENRSNWLHWWWYWFAFRRQQFDLSPMVFDNEPLHYEYDAFVSYNVADSDWIFNQLVPNLERNTSGSDTKETAATTSTTTTTNDNNRRIRLCVYDRDFIAGRPITECILESIRVSRRVILVVSNAFIKSPWCQYETDLAHQHNTTLNRTGGLDGLILIKLEPLQVDLPIPIQLQFLLQTRIYLEWNPSQPKIFWDKLKQALSVRESELVLQQQQKQRSKAKPISINTNKDLTITDNDYTSTAITQEPKQIKWWQSYRTKLTYCFGDILCVTNNTNTNTITSTQMMSSLNSKEDQTVVNGCYNENGNKLNGKTVKIVTHNKSENKQTSNDQMTKIETKHQNNILRWISKQYVNFFSFFASSSSLQTNEMIMINNGNKNNDDNMVRCVKYCVIYAGDNTTAGDDGGSFKVTSNGKQQQQQQKESN